tara:strand:+ start:3207 stop:3692 length:486 start_codon:yes stop_codon:yes gene_type:complete
MIKIILEKYPNYEIYENGEIYNIKKKKYMSQRIHKSGHLRVDLVDVNKKIITRTIHSLVFEAFYNELVHYPYCVDHIDNDKTNNHYLNLQKISSVQNTIKSYLVKFSKKTNLPYCIKEWKKKQIYYFKFKKEILFEDRNLLNVIQFKTNYLKSKCLCGVVC